MEPTEADAPQRRRRVSALRLVLVLVLFEAVAYFVAFLVAAGRLGAGAATGSVSVETTLFGLTLFRGERHGYVTTLESAAWLLPALVALPVLVWAAVLLAQRRLRW